MAMVEPKLIFQMCAFGLIFLISIACTGVKNLHQHPTQVTDLKIKGIIDIAEIDNLGRIYTANDKNTIINYKPDFQEQYRYANSKSGKVSSIDVNDALRIVTFYDDFNRIKIFDNTLTIIQELNLSETYVDISACGTSNDGNLWIYDPIQFKLLKINEKGEVIFETSNVNDFGMKGVNISSIREKSNIVVLVDSAKGFYFFDNFGQYLYHLSAPDIKSYQFDGENLLFYQQGYFKLYSLKYKEVQDINLNEEIKFLSPKLIKVYDKTIYIIHQDGLSTFPIKG